LPTRDDWDNLLRAVGGVRKVDEDGDVVFEIVGKKLKSKSGWDGTDDFGFSALPGGGRYGCSLYDVGKDGSWWSATEGGNGAYYRYMNSGYDYVYEHTDVKSGGFSVRCAQD
jgi:uncharacterized protein (TIGR02145 family)